MTSMLSLGSDSYHEATQLPAMSTLKVFRVKNVDDRGRIIHIGYLEVTESDIVFRYEHHPAHISRWPLDCIRKYGVNLEGDVFAFEAGRRAPEGEGLYAFKTEDLQACEIRQRLDYHTHYATALNSRRYSWSSQTTENALFPLFPILFQRFFSVLCNTMRILYVHQTCFILSPENCK